MAKCPVCTYNSAPHDAHRHMEALRERQQLWVALKECSDTVKSTAASMLELQEELRAITSCKRFID